jgi:hypothetical protein
MFYDNTKIAKNTLYRNLADDLSPRNVSEKGFDFAYGLVDFYGNPLLKEEYLSVNVY